MDKRRLPSSIGDTSSGMVANSAENQVFDTNWYRQGQSKHKAHEVFDSSSNDTDVDAERIAEKEAEEAYQDLLRSRRGAEFEDGRDVRRRSLRDNSASLSTRLSGSEVKPKQSDSYLWQQHPPGHQLAFRRGERQQEPTDPYLHFNVENMVQLQPIDPANEWCLHSTNIGAVTAITFLNRSDQVVKIWRINSKGARRFDIKLRASEMIKRVTRVTNPWVVTFGETGVALGIWYPASREGIAIINTYVDQPKSIVRTSITELTNKLSASGIVPKGITTSSYDKNTSRVFTSKVESSSRLQAPRYDQPAITPSTHHGSAIETQSHVTSSISSKQTKSSVYSYSSSYLQERYGGTSNVNNAYFFPTDETEWDRLDKLQSQFLLAWNGLYPCPELVESVLAPTGHLPKQILDIGYGTGSWALQMATAYPHANVRGVDLSPSPIDVASWPPNLRLEIDDVNHGLSRFFGQFDLVHARCILTGISDPVRTIEEMQRCLRPGGLFILIDEDIDLIDDVENVKLKMAKVEGDEDVMSVSEGGSYFQRIIWEAYEAATLAGSGHKPGSELIDRGLWNSPLCDPDTAGGGSVKLPVGPWSTSRNPADSQALRYAGILMRQGFYKTIRAYESILRRYGLSQKTIDDWTKHADEEIATLKFHTWCRFRFCWARRRADEGESAPLLPVKLDSSSTPTHQYPMMEIYKTLEEAMAARNKRLESIGKWPTAAVKRVFAARQIE